MRAKSSISEIDAQIDKLREKRRGILAKANERFARDNGLSGTPVIVRSDGAMIEGFRPREAIAAWLRGAKS